MKEERGVVVKVFGLYSTVRRGDRRINCVLRGKLRMRPGAERYSSPLAVGDSVIFEDHDDGTGVINRIEKRRNEFSRKDRGRNKKVDVIASNLDQIVVILAFRKPKLNPRFMDRVVVRGTSDNIPVRLCVNKADLAKKDAVRYVNDYYKGAGTTVAVVSALKGTGMDDFRELIQGKVSLLIGYSGVGKTSLLKSLYPDLDLRIRDVSESTGKGRHTTTNVEMIHHADGTSIIDSPGLREFGLMDIEPHMLGGLFYEFSRFSGSCSFSPCSHDHEPDCEIKRQVEKGVIHEDRYISYLNILYSLKEYREHMYS